MRLLAKNIFLANSSWTSWFSIILKHQHYSICS